MAFIDDQLKIFRDIMEEAIISGGTEGKASIIRSSSLIHLIHDSVKKELIDIGVNPNNIFPKFGIRRPEKKLAGFLKQKNQDVCVVPSNIQMERTPIDWGPLASEGKIDEYGFAYTINTLVINVRSQMSSLAKNADTLFERTFAEALNLHLRYPDIVLGEVYLIPAYEYDDTLVSRKKVGFTRNKTNIEKYISFFSAMNGRESGEDDYAYERATLLIVDFNREEPFLYRTTEQLKADGLISRDFSIPYEPLMFDTFAKDILEIYSKRWDISNLM